MTDTPKPKAPKKRKPKTHITLDHPTHGRIEVRHMRGVVHGEPCTLLAAASTGTAEEPVWIQLAKQGRFLGHPSGPFEMNAKTFEEIVRNFKAHPEHLPIDFEHASEMSASEGSIPHSGAPAQGWIVDMRIQDGNLWGLVEWGELAREYITSKKYKYFSPAVRLGAKDRVTGKPIGARMTSGGLTNNPFLSGMQAIAAKDTDDDLDDEDDDIEDTEIPAGAADNNPKAGDRKMTEAKLKDAEDKIVVLNDRFTMADAKLKDAERTITAKDAELVMLRDENKNLLAWKTEREEHDQKAEVEIAFETYKDQRKLSDANRGSMLSFLKAAPTAFREMYPAIPAGQRHLMRNIAGDGPKTAAAGQGSNVVSMADRTRQLMDEKKLSFEDAQREVSRENRNVFTRGAR